MAPNDPQKAPVAGDVLAGRFVLASELGRGSCGTVFAARDRVSGELLALKLLRPEALRDDGWRGEIALLAAIRHPCLVRLRDVVVGARPFFTMDLVAGEDLDHRPLEAGALADVARQLLGVLAFLHGRGLVHRDVKPSNVRVTPEGRAVLLDAGLAGPAGAGEPTAGTPALLAPELLRGCSPNPRSDLYALGRTLALAAGADARSRWGSLLERLAADAPDDRPPDAGTALAELERALGEAAPAAVLPGPRLVGRAPELAAADAALAALAEADGAGPRVLLLVGAPGSGRGRLLAALRHRAQLLGLPVIGAADLVPGAAPGEDAGAGPTELAADAVSASGLRGARRLADTILERGQGRPLVVTVDAADGDDGLTELVGELGFRLAAPDPPPVLMLVRAGTGAGGLADLAARLGDVAHTLTLGPLSTEAVGTLVEDALGLPAGAAGSGLAGTVLAASGGLPGAVLDLLRVLVGRRWLEVVDGRPVLRATPEDLQAASGSPAGLLSDLGSGEREALLQLAALGVPAGPRVRAALGIGPGRVDRLVRRGLLHTSWSGGVERVAPCVRLDGVAPSRERHRLLAHAIGQASSELGAGSELLLAEHRLAAGEVTGGRSALELAARELRRGRPSRARRLLRRLAAPGSEKQPFFGGAARLLALVEAAAGAGDVAGALLDRLEGSAPSDRERARALRVRGEVKKLLGDVPGAEKALDASLATARLPRSERMAALRTRAVCRLQRGSPDAALDDARAARRLAKAADEDRALCAGVLTQVLHRMGRRAEARTAVGEALALLDGLPRASGVLEGNLLALRGMCRAADGDRRGAARDMERAAELLRREGHLVNLAGTLNNLGVLRERFGDFRRALACYEEALRIQRRVGDAVGSAASLANRGTMRMLLGRLSEARRDLEGALAAFERQDHPAGRTSLRAELARLEAETGRVGAARRQAQRAAEEARVLGAPDVRLRAALALAEARLAGSRPDPDGAEEAMADVAGDATDGPPAAGGAEEGVRWLVCRARLARAAGRGDEARACAEAAWDLADLEGRADLRLRAWLVLARSGSDLPRARERLSEDLAGLDAPLLELEVLMTLDPPNGARIAALTRRAMEQLDDGDRKPVWERRFHQELARVLDRLESGTGGPGQEVEALVQATRLLSADATPDEMLVTILDTAIELADARRGFVVLRDGDDFSCAAARSRNKRNLRVPRSLVSSTIVQDVLARGKPVSTGDARSDPRFQSMGSVRRLKLSSVVCLPFTVEGRVEGALYLDHSGRGDAFGPDRVRLLSALADHAAVALTRSQTAEEIRRLNGELGSLLQKERTRLEAAERELGALRGEDVPAGIVAESQAFRAVLETVDRVARTDMPVLVVGETGCGKDVVAREIHRRSSRSNGPYLSENCAAIPGGLLESELFGFVRGAFTGAHQDRKGLLQLADGGTLFLDEVGELDPDLQSKLLRALEEGAVRPLGGRQAVPLSFRLVSATNRPLEELREGVRFRRDLFYRISAVVIEIPPLRERQEDVAAFIDRFSGRLHIEPDARRLLLAYDWPGNFRELGNELQRLEALAEHGIVTEGLLSDRIRAARPRPREEEIPFALDELRRWAVDRALRTVGGDKRQAARLLGVSRSTLYEEVRRHGLTEYLRRYRKSGS